MIDDDFEPEQGFWRRSWLPIVIVSVLLAGGGYVGYKVAKGGSGAAPKVEKFVSIAMPPPAPPPPPPPPPPPKIPPPQMQQPKMVEQSPVSDPEPKPDSKPEPPKAPDAPAPIGSNIKGDGNDGFGLSGNGGTGLGFGNGKGGGKAGSKYGWYAGMVQSRIEQALRDNSRTKGANMRVEVRIWPDSTGRITRAQLAQSTGDAGLDAALQNEVLTGLRLSEPPPAGMPTPIVMRLTARRP